MPEYNHGYPAALKNALDHLFSEWGRKPAGVVSYGGPGGGVRATEQLRQVAVELDMVPVRRQVAIANVWEAFDQSGRFSASAAAAQQAEVLFDDLVWWAQTLRDGRATEAQAA